MKTIRILLSSLAITAMFVAPSVAMADGDNVSKSPPFWTYPASPPTGETKLVRTPQGLTAQFKTTGLPAGHAMTMWIMFFNNPVACAAPGACNPGDAPNPATGFDFHYAGGHVVNGNKTTISGHVQVGETSTSGWAELGLPAVALTNPQGAQVILAIHSHGPAQTGQTLAAQMSSYLGGCLTFLGDAGGFAQSPGDIPANAGECSTIQVAFHNP